MGVSLLGEEQSLLPFSRDEMYALIAGQLEKVTTDNAAAAEPSKLRLLDKDGVVWKFDLIEMTQRRIKDCKDENTRRIRRIFVCDD